MEKIFRLKAYCENPEETQKKCTAAGALLLESEISKKRTVFRWRSAIIRFNSIDGLGDFVELEIDGDKAEGPDAVLKTAEEFKTMLKISVAETVPWSYAEMEMIHKAGHIWRSKIAGAEKPGTLFLLDGPSCSGKTTLAHKLTTGSGAPVFVRRYCTRKPRKSETTETEYIFISTEEFRKLAGSGYFIEYRDYLFGMSYGLPWKNAVLPLTQGSNALGLINLGNVLHVKKIFPEAVLILINAPLDTIRKRLIERGFNKEEQIEERIANAATVEGFKQFYNYIVDNDDGQLEQTEKTIRKIIEQHTGCQWK